MNRFIAVTALMASMSGVAFAEPKESTFQEPNFFHPHFVEPHFIKSRFDSPRDHGPAVVKAPEMDPASAASGLTLLMGGLMVLRGRRAK